MAAGEHPEVVLEATYGWYWAADWLAEIGCKVHLAHPLGNNWGHRRVKNDVRDAEDLADLLRLGRLAEAWIAPPEVQGAPRDRALQGQARLPAHQLQAAGLRSARQRGRDSPDDRPVRRRRQRAARELPPRHGLPHPRRVAARPDRGLRPRDRTCSRPTSATSSAARLGYRGDPVDPWRRPAVRRGVRGRDRRRHEVQLPGTARELGGPYAEAPRVGPDRAPGPDHQARFPPRAMGGGRGGPTPGEQAPSCGPTSPASPPTTATPPAPARSPGSPWRERSSPSSTTAFGTAPSAPRPSRRRRDAASDTTRRVVAAGHGPRFAGVAAPLIDPVWLVAATLHADNGAGMTGNRVSALPSRSTLRTWRRHLVSLSAEQEVADDRLNHSLDLRQHAPSRGGSVKASLRRLRRP